MLDARHCEQSLPLPDWGARRVAASSGSPSGTPYGAWGWLWPITINQSPKMLAFFSLIFAMICGILWP